tara:strand:- start:42 stop:395 length:354 start_codon:yes stop_codon:yes gene_type:complete
MERRGFVLSVVLILAVAMFAGSLGSDNSNDISGKPVMKKSGFSVDCNGKPDGLRCGNVLYGNGVCKGGDCIYSKNCEDRYSCGGNCDDNKGNCISENNKCECVIDKAVGFWSFYYNN